MLEYYLFDVISHFNVICSDRVLQTNEKFLGFLGDLTLVAWDTFKKCNNTIKEYVLNSQIKYEKNCVDQIKSNPKIFDSYIRHQEVCHPTAGPIRSTESIITDYPKSNANCFADAFLAVFTDTVPPYPESPQGCYNYFNFQSVDVCEVLEVLNNLDQNS